jgi:hypothetical protein
MRATRPLALKTNTVQQHKYSHSDNAKSYIGQATTGISIELFPPSEMQWEQLFNENWDDSPRYLTDDELDFIVSELPKIPCPDRVARDAQSTDVRNWLYDELSQVQLCPSTIAELKREIYFQHHKSLEIPGKPVGLDAAESMAAATQKTLNTFKNAGSSQTTTFGIEAIRDLIFAVLKKNPETEICSVYFDPVPDVDINGEPVINLATGQPNMGRFNTDDILDMRSNVVGYTIMDLIQKDAFEIMAASKLSRPWWYALWREPLPKTVVMRLHLNNAALYKYKVYPIEIKNRIESVKKLSKEMVKCVSGPICEDTIVDVYVLPAPDNNPDYWGDPNNAELVYHKMRTFLRDVVYPLLASPPALIGGVHDIHSLRPVSIPLWSAILEEKKLEDDYRVARTLGGDTKNRWVLYLNIPVMRERGMMATDIVTMLYYCLDIAQPVFGPSVVVKGATIPRYLVVTSVTRPSELHRTMIRQARALKSVDVKNLNKEREAAERIVDLRATTEEAQRETANELKRLEAISNRTPELEQQLADTRIKLAHITDIRSEATRIVKEIGAMNPDFLTEEQEDDLLAAQDLLSTKITEEEYTTARYILEAIGSTTAPKTKDVVNSEMENAQKNLDLCMLTFAECKGSNLLGLYMVPNVDTTRTTCNNIHTIAKVLGIQAARASFIKILNDTLQACSISINITHLQVIADLVMNLGAPHGATYTGISRGRVGAMTKLYVEKTVDVVKNYALYRRPSEIHNVAESVAFGARVMLGTGYSDILQQVTIEGKTFTVINDQPLREVLLRQGAVSNNELESALDTVNNKTRQQLVPLTKKFPRQDVTAVNLSAMNRKRQEQEVYKPPLPIHVEPLLHLPPLPEVKYKQAVTNPLLIEAITKNVLVSNPQPITDIASGMQTFSNLLYSEIMPSPLPVTAFIRMHFLPVVAELERKQEELHAVQTAAPQPSILASLSTLRPIAQRPTPEEFKTLVSEFGKK